MQSISERRILFGKVLGEVQPYIKWIHNDSPLMYLDIKEVYSIMRCTSVVGTFVTGVHLAEFYSNNIPKGGREF